ncbi:MAG: hypothetical protein AB7N73_12315 [Gemmatimonadales bacterium]|jgi:hypothetical protein
MKVRVVATTLGCEGGNCPTTYVTGEGTVIVQGFETRPGQVRVPASLLARHAELEGARTWTGPARPLADGWVLVDGAAVEQLDGVEVPGVEALVEIVGEVIA